MAWLYCGTAEEMLLGGWTGSGYEFCTTVSSEGTSLRTLRASWPLALNEVAVPLVRLPYSAGARVGSGSAYIYSPTLQSYPCAWSVFVS